MPTIARRTLLLGSFTWLLAGCAKKAVVATDRVPAPQSPPSPDRDARSRPGSTEPPETDRIREAHERSPKRPAHDDGRDGAPRADPERLPERPPIHRFEDHAALRDVYFGFDRHDITADGAALLDANATWILEHPRAVVLVEGHCDERGTDQYNLALGERRAKAAASYLVSRGVGPARLRTISYGKERPTCSESTETCWSRNRRAHFKVMIG